MFRIDYRQEINGLRALAVLPVVFYHAKFSLFQGGFVGVDIFFVISGYLISGIIFTELSTSSFSLVNFYERRARRILPALFVVLIFSTLISWILLPPIEFKDFGQSLFSVSLFASNFLFWFEGGYFDTGIDLKPLLHTWSLAVEEQFYILFPLLAILLFSVNKRFLLPVILLLFFTSLFLAHIFSEVNFDINSKKGSFYFLPTRAWELLMGALLFFIPKSTHTPSKDLLNNVLSLTGLFLIAFSIYSFDEDTPFPSIFTLIPTSGAVLVILYGVKGTLANKMLSTKPFIIIGLISYSAYLWHQPLLSLSRFYFVGELETSYLSFLILLTFLLAYLSWRFIEEPFRNKKKISRKFILIFSLSGTLFFSAVGLGIHFNEGFENRYTSSQIELLNFKSYKERDELYRNRVCFLRRDMDESSFSDICTDGPIYIWGDSHAASISYGMRKLNKLSQYTSSMCPPILELDIPGRPHCSNTNEAIFNSIDSNNPKLVFLSANWILKSYKDSYSSLEKTFDRLSYRYPNINFYVLGGLPQWTPALPNTMVKADQLLQEKETYLKNQLYHEVKLKDIEIERIVNRSNENVKFISLLNLLCRDDECLSQVSYPKNEPTAFDYGHLTGSGSIKVSSLIFESINYQKNNN